MCCNLGSSVQQTVSILSRWSAVSFADTGHALKFEDEIGPVMGYIPVSQSRVTLGNTSSNKKSNAEKHIYRKLDRF